MSKNIRLPPRVQLIMSDNQTGSYPTNSRVGDNRTGRYPVSFNDTKTINFTTGTVLNYPTLLNTSSPYLVGISSSLSYSGTVRRGIADEFASIILPGQTSSYFIESNHIENDDVFFLTGSKIENVGFGLNEKLGSKIKIVIDINPAATTMIGHHYASASSTSVTDDSYKMMYFNHVTKMWEGIFQGIKFKHGEPAANTTTNLAKQTSGFSPSVDFVNKCVTNGLAATARNAARPYDTYGFPYDPRYHATSSQLFNLSSVIDTPFVLEKIHYEFSGTLTNPCTAAENPSKANVPITTFFMLNQRKSIEMTVIRTLLTGSQKVYVATSIPSSVQLTTGSSAPSTVVDTIRDVVTYLQVAVVDDYLTGTFPSALQYIKRDLTLSGAIVNDQKAWSGKYAMSSSIRAPMKSTEHGKHWIGNELATSSWGGGRFGLELPTGRSFTSDIDGVKISGSADLGGLGDILFPVSQSYDSPYVLLPTDNVIFGWEIPHGVITPRADPGYYLSMHPGAGKVTLYGTQLRENKTYNNTVNQPLTTPAVHEALIGQAVVDQFDTEPKRLFSGSMLAEYNTGSMSIGIATRGKVVSTIQDGRNIYENSAVGLHLLEKAAIPGFTRTAQAISEHERFYDSFVPDPEDITRIDGAVVYKTAYQGSFSSDSFISIVVLGNNITDGADNLTGISTDNTWIRAFPFEPKYESALRVSARQKIKSTAVSEGFVGAAWALGAPDLNSFAVAQCMTAAAGVVKYKVLGQISNATSLGPSPFRNAIIHYYGIGDAEYGSVGFTHATANGVLGQANASGSLHRGWKYGIINPFEYKTKTHWNRKHYGYFRDLFEQRIDSKMYDIVGLNADGTKSGKPGVTSSPVTIQFVEPRSLELTQATRTFSSNLSNEATSSMPYFDDKVKNREEPILLSNINTASIM